MLPGLTEESWVPMRRVSLVLNWPSLYSLLIAILKCSYILLNYSSSDGSELDRQESDKGDAHTDPLYSWRDPIISVKTGIVKCRM